MMKFSVSHTAPVVHLDLTMIHTSIQLYYTTAMRLRKLRKSSLRVPITVGGRVHLLEAIAISLGGGGGIVDLLVSVSLLILSLSLLPSLSLVRMELLAFNTIDRRKRGRRRRAPAIRMTRVPPRVSVRRHGRVDSYIDPPPHLAFSPTPRKAHTPDLLSVAIN